MDPATDWPCTPSLISSWPLNTLLYQWHHAQRYTCKRSLSTSWSSPMTLLVAYHESLWLLQLMAWTPGVSSTHHKLMATLTLGPQPITLYAISFSLRLTSNITLTCISIQYTHNQVSPAADTTDIHAPVVSVSGCWHSPHHCLMPLGSPCTWRWTSYHRA